MNTSKTALLTIIVTTFSFTSSATTSNWSTSASAVLTHQRAQQTDIKNETELSADFLINRKSGNGEWIGHIEGVTTPSNDGVSSILIEVNGDVGSALNRNNQGRIQLSELYYTHQFQSQQILSVGLLDLSGFFEQSRIASDENTQFLGASFTGNPTIEFPDYSLGIVYEHVIENGLTLRAAMASSNGLADNTDRSYSQLLSVNTDSKGIVAIASASWKSRSWLFRLGAWTNTADHLHLANDDENLNNYGVYILSGFKQGRHGVNFRLGVANPNVSQAAQFTSMSYQYEREKMVVGVGVAKAILSSREVNLALQDSIHYESYIRFSLTPSFFLTADAQYIKNSGFGLLKVTQDTGITVLGVRLSYLFE